MHRPFAPGGKAAAPQEESEVEALKYKLLGAALCLCAVALSLAAPLLEDDTAPRFHQHLEEPGYTPCTDHGEGVFCSHLPLIFIETGGVEIPGLPVDESGEPVTSDMEYQYVTKAADGSSTIACAVSVVDTSGQNHHIADEPSLQTDAQIRIRGNTSRYFDKKGYLLRLTSDDGKSIAEEMLGMDAHDEWALHGPCLDKSLLRNYMWYNIAGEFMDYAPNVRFCEVFIDGEYQGVYVLTETITNGIDGHGRLNLTASRDDLTETSYVIRKDRGSSNPIKNIEIFTQYSRRNLLDVDIVWPGAENLTPERISYIKQEFSAFEKSLYSYDYDTEEYVWNYADMDSFVDYFIVHEFTCNYDVGYRSTYMYRDIRGKYKMCIWDFNSACDNFHETVTELQRFEVQNIVWFWMMKKDEKFTSAVIDRYRELRESYLSDEYLTQYIDDVVEWLGPAVDRNFEVWGYTFDEWRPLDPSTRNPGSYEAAVQQIKDFCCQRGAWMDENIDTLRQYSAESAVKKFNENAN